MKIEIVRLDKSLPLPAYQHIGEDVGLDLRAAEEVIIKRGESQLIKTGIKLAIPPGYGGFVYPRSGLALKHGITLLNSVGVIDPGYSGELGVVLINHGKEDLK